MEKKQSESIRNQRRPKGIVSELTINLLHLKKPLDNGLLVSNVSGPRIPHYGELYKGVSVDYRG